ncbi:unnamed protein product [Blepharisma stoltei]|uniref:Uncharacterized protein n=1 Tax=Blepharisma stoltei TaxID=1481888 RepID=A0AAU9JKD2_9CILI|nr:unnamed protein product [Blepharisma stoltei]
MLLLILLGLTEALVCPTIQCKDLKDGVCAEINGNDIFIGGCSNETMKCNLADIMPAYKAQQRYVNCTIRTREMYQISEQRKGQLNSSLCHRRNGDLESSTFGWRCDTDDDCKIKGSAKKWYCECAFDGYSYCLPAPNDQIMRDMFDSICDGKIDDFLKSSLTVNLFPYTQNLPGCVDDKFSDYQLLMHLQDGTMQNLYQFFDDSFATFIKIAGVISICLAIL